MGRLAEWHGIARAHPAVTDALLAAALFVASLLPVNPPGGGLSLAAVLLAAIGSGALAVRRRHPLPVLAVTTVSVALAQLAGVARGPMVLTVAIAAYTVATRADRRTAAVAGLVGALAVGAAAIATLGVVGPDPAVVVLLLWIGVAVAVGDAVRSRRAYVAVLAEGARRAERTLRPEETGASTEPAPSLNRLDALVEGFSTGQPVRWTVAGQPRPLPTAVDVAAYRIIQESLTNAHRHAPGAAVAVRLRYDPEGVTIEVRDTGAETSPSPGPSAGLGLLGMRERAEAVGGTFTAGPRPDGGWSVRAELPAAEEQAE
ncbi:sensor histidine kinase [Micromonospora purpureochromogenes]|uniref:histidine kinase n=1 Tax=Micromonospora purpureochromogenes TaxID=47872 RepID=A0ABX2RDM1_9ACTN|nr:ATP-binding protein [Micromonospora purpureochromogenes]NYF54585.1 signal transduction histidine kinase [Micromonospora purpureochromogenes]